MNQYKRPAPMNQYKGIDLPQVMHTMSAEIATLFGELYTWMDSEEFQPTYYSSQSGMDHLRSAALQLSIHTAHHLEDLIDWDHYEHGVFSYDYCEYEIPSLLKDALTPEEWYQMANNYVVPNNLRDMLRDWVMTQPKMKLKG